MKRENKISIGVVFGLVILSCFFWSRVYDYNIESWRTGGGKKTPEVFLGQVQRLEWSTETPDQRITFWCTTNRTVDAYILTDEQYDADSETQPSDYLNHYRGQSINVTFTTSMDGGVRYNLVIYPETAPVLVYNHGIIVEHEGLKRQVNMFYLVLGLLTAFTLLITAISPYVKQSTLEDSMQ